MDFWLSRDGAVLRFVQRLLGFSIQIGAISRTTRSVNSRFVLFCETSKTLEELSALRKHRFHLYERNFFDFSYHWSRSLLYSLYRVLKMHYLLPICKERFSIHTALVLLHTAILLFFRFSYASIFSSHFAYQEPLFFFLFSAKGGISMCVCCVIGTSLF